MSGDWRTIHELEELGSWQETWQLLSLLAGQAFDRLREAPTVAHCSTKDIRLRISLDHQHSQELTTERRARPAGTSEPVRTATPTYHRHELRLIRLKYQGRLTVWREHISRTRRRRPGTHLRLVAARVLRRPALLARGRKPALAGAARAAHRVAHRARAELARRGVAARRGDVEPRVAVLAVLDDAVAAHLERDRVLGERGVDEAGRVCAVRRGGEHEGA